MNELDRDGYQFFGEVVPIERDYGFDLRIRSDGVVKIDGKKLVTWGWYRSPKPSFPPHHYEFEIGEVVNVYTAHDEIRNYDKLYRVDQMPEGNLGLFDMGAEKFMEAGEPESPEEIGRISAEALSALDGEVREKMNWMYQGGAEKIWKVMRIPSIILAANGPYDGKWRYGVQAISSLCLIGVK